MVPKQGQNFAMILLNPAITRCKRIRQLFCWYSTPYWLRSSSQLNFLLVRSVDLAGRPNFLLTRDDTRQEKKIGFETFWSMLSETTNMYSGETVWKILFESSCDSTNVFTCVLYSPLRAVQIEIAWSFLPSQDDHRLKQVKYIVKMGISSHITD